MLKNKLWLFQIPFVALYTGAYLITEQGLQGGMTGFWADKVYPNLQRVTTVLHDAKFRFRGPQKPKNNIVIIDVNSNAIDKYGRWPWHRDIIARLIDNTFAAGAKVVGLDIVFSEQDPRVSEDLKQFLTSKGMADQLSVFETDNELTATIARYRDRLVLGMATEALCHPNRAYRGIVMKVPPEGGEPKPTVDFDADECPVGPESPEVAQSTPQNFDKFALSNIVTPPDFDSWKTPIWNALTFLPNIDMYNDVAVHSALFSAFPDQDQVIRRAPLFVESNRKFYATLPFEMARVGLDEKIDVKFNNSSGIERLTFAKSGREIPVTTLGGLEINFRGGSHSFTYVPAEEMLDTSTPVFKDEVNRRVANVAKTDVLKDAYAIIGVSALGVFDMRAFPMDHNVPGVEGHANVLDNLLSGDMMVPSYRSHRTWILCVMVFGALLFAYAVQRLEAVPALILFMAVFFGFGFADFKILFEQNISLNSTFFYLELFTIFFVILAAKYVIEERSKKFVRSAFAKYVAPAVVDSILKDPEKLQVGGLKKDLTIMFSDIRSFTTFSEKMDAPKLAHFLNDYLGIMTKIVFANEGTLDKYIGDAIMAFWGAPLDQPQHAANACKAAQAMMKALHENKERWLKDFNVDVNIGVGINSGPVNVGNMGSTNNFSYTVIGDHVNLSSRLEGLTKEYGVSILTTRFTFDEIVKASGEIPAHRVLDNTKVKGKKNAVELIQVLDRPMQKEGLELFAEGRKLYLAQEWDQAIGKFREANSILAVSVEKPDGPSHLFIERCEEFKKNPPGKDWDGSWEMHHK
jgi:adenylate cyclase